MGRSRRDLHRVYETNEARAASVLCRHRSLIGRAILRFTLGPAGISTRQGMVSVWGRGSAGDVANTSRGTLCKMHRARGAAGGQVSTLRCSCAAVQLLAGYGGRLAAADGIQRGLAA